MVFGWGKKKKKETEIIETTTESVERKIVLDDIEKILKDLKEIRTKTLIAEAGSFRNKISPQFDELNEIAIQLEKDSLKVDDIDKHLKAIVERGKKQVISIIKEETTAKLPDVKNTDDVISVNGQLNRSLKRIGDVLGRQTRVIHLFAKKYAGKLKTILSDLENDRDTIQTLIDNHKKLQDGILEITSDISTIDKSKQSLEKKSKRILNFENALSDFEKQTQKLNDEIKEIKDSEKYSKFLQVREQLGRLDPEKNNLRREINDQFTKISRPLGKYEYVSSMDKEQKALLKILVDNPFEALSSPQKNNIITIIQSVKKGVISGFVSVKDTDKSVQFLDETTELLDSLIKQKESFSVKEDSLKDEMRSFDLNKLKEKEIELEKTINNHNDTKSKISQFQTEVSELKSLIPKLTMDIEHRLREISSTKYMIETKNS